MKSKRWWLYAALGTLALLLASSPRQLPTSLAAAQAVSQQSELVAGANDTVREGVPDVRQVQSPEPENAVAELSDAAANMTGTVFYETEPNDNKTDANGFVMEAGDAIVGTSTGSSGTNLDYFRVRTRVLPPGVYRHRFVITTGGTAGHTGTIRGRAQSSGNIDPNSDSSYQSSSTSTNPPRMNQWYGFGKGEEIFYRVAGTSSTTAPYTATLYTDPVTVVDVPGTFVAGWITITTDGQGHTTDTDLWVYDSGFNAIPTYGNDNKKTPPTSTRSELVRIFEPGTYYLALSNNNFANDQPSPPDDNYRAGQVLDFPNAAANSSTSANLNLQFAIIDATGVPVTVPNTKLGPFDVNWFRFTVLPATSGACCVNYVCVATTTEADCVAAGGTWYGGYDCASFFCPPWNDECGAVTPVTLEPGLVVEFTGTTLGATPDCLYLPGRQVWHAVTLPGPAPYWDVTLDFCGTVPRFGTVSQYWALGCPCSGSSGGGTLDWTTCGDPNNGTVRWRTLPSGTYYYPVYYDPNLAAGSYVIHVRGVPAYCQSAPQYPYDATIDRVRMTDPTDPNNWLDNDTTGICDTYDDFRSLPPMHILRGRSYPLDITLGDCTPDSCYARGLRVFIDWNADWDFTDPDETVLTQNVAANPCVQTVTTTVTVPPDAVLGPTAMRVVCWQTTDANQITPCGGASAGATEDYALTIGPAPATGACCVGMTCQDGLTEWECLNVLGGVYRGDGSTCGPPNPCIGACCLATGTCQEVPDEAACIALGGSFLGLFTTCTPNPCPQPGACCYPDGSCTMSTVVAPGDCGPDGYYKGDDTTCSPNTCPQPGDNCLAPKVLVLPPPVWPLVDADTTCERARDYYNTCLGTYDNGEDMVYKLIVTEDVCMQVTLATNTSHTGIAIDDSCPVDASECLYSGTNAAAGGVTLSNVMLSASVGTYYVLINTSTVMGCIPNFTLTFAPCPQAIPGDLCAEAIPITTLPFTHVAQMPEATHDYNINPSCDTSCGDYAGWGIWYSWTPAETCWATIAVSGVDTVTSLWLGPDCDHLTQLTCSDPQSTSLMVNGGEHYLICVSKWSCTTPPASAVTTTVSCMPIPGVDFTVTAPGAWSNSTAGAGNDCWLESSPDHIYEVTIPYAGVWIFDTCDSAYDTRLYIGSSVCSGDLGYDDDSCDTPNALGSRIQKADLPAGTYYVHVEGYSGAAGAYTLRVQPACEVTCRPGSLIEPEPCGTHTNEGCNATPPVFVDIEPGETYCGWADTYDVDFRDTDWYRLVLAYPAEVSWTVTSEFPSQAMILSGACGQLAVEAYGYGGDCAPTAVTKALPAGTYYLFVSLGTSSGGIFTGYPCSAASDYVATVTCVAVPGACCTPAGCTLLSEPDCDAIGGIWMGMYSSCDVNDCNGNGLPDACEVVVFPERDCNGNQVPDDCDVASGTSADCQNDGVPDECQLSGRGREIVYAENFDDVNNLPGWFRRNNSEPLGSTGWFQGNTNVFSAQSGPANSYIAANFNNTGGNGNISNWLVHPPAVLRNGMVLRFYTRSDACTMPDCWADRLQVRMSLNGESLDVGSTWDSVGDFTTLLLDINPTYVPNGYPQSWDAGYYEVTLHGIPEPTLGRLAFRYFVEDAGYYGTNSNYIGIDTVSLETPGAPPANDCNWNEIPDECDIQEAFGGYCHEPTYPPCDTDYNHNGVPDHCEPCGDLNGDGLVDALDYWIMLDGFGRCAPDPQYVAASAMDVNGNNCIDLVDYQAWFLCYKMANGKAFVPPPQTRPRASLTPQAAPKAAVQ